jgi:fluoride exporter
VGICGGFTTFSSFSIENVHLLQNGKVLLSAVYILSSLIICIGAAWFGYHVGIKN